MKEPDLGLLLILSILFILAVACLTGIIYIWN